MNNLVVDRLRKMLQYGNCEVTVTGNSMEPIFTEGTSVTVSKAESLMVNDVILYYRKDKLILHRVVCIYNDMIITKGDNNSFVDHAISRGDVLGKVKNVASDHITVEKPKIIYNIWNPNFFEKIKKYIEKLSLAVINKPNVFFEDGINVADCPYSTSKIGECAILKSRSVPKIYVHIGVPISDFPCDNFVLSTEFAAVFRSGTYAANYILDEEERFIILYNEIETRTE